MSGKGKHEGCDARPQDVCNPAFGGGKRKDAIGGRNQPTREDDALGLIAVEQGIGRVSVDHGGELPGQIDGIANAGVHSLAAGRRMNMCSITGEEGAALPEMLRYPMMDMIGREPVDLPDLDFQMLDGAAADIFEFKAFGVLSALVSYSADQARATLAREREDGEKVGLVEVDVQFAIGCWPCRLDICDIEQLPIGAPGKPGAQALAHQ